MTPTRLALVVVVLVGCGDDGAPPGTGGSGSGMCDAAVAGSSFDRIDAAYATGAIDLETSIEFKAFAEFGDARLPASCQGDDSEVIDSDLFDLIEENWQTLSPDAQAVLEPFVIPPVYVGSWASPAPRGKRTIGRCNVPEIDPAWVSDPPLGNGMFKVWFDPRVAGQASQAELVLAAVQDDIYPALVDRLQMMHPMTDATNDGCNGGDGRIDIYLVDMKTHGSTPSDFGETFPIDQGTKARPAFIYVNRGLDDKTMRATLAHEFMHVVQWAYPVKGAGLRASYPWLKEATAQWAIDYVYPTLVDNFEQKKAPDYLIRPWVSINSKVFGAGFTYGSYLFFQFLARTGDPSIIKNIWDETIMEADEVQAVDKAIPSGFKKQWPEFAKLLWNQDPVDLSSFQAWDKLVAFPFITQQRAVALDATGYTSQVLDGNLDHLGIRYYFFTFDQTDTTLRSVAFSAPSDRLSVQAFVKIGDGIREWKDWRHDSLVHHYCIDVKAERLSELTIILSNDSPTEDLQMADLEQPRLVVSSVGCWRYQGTTSVKTQDLFTDQTVTTNVTLEVDHAPQWTNDYFLHYMVQTGNGSMTADTNDGGNCASTYAGNGGLDIGEAGGNVDVSLGFDLGAGMPFGRTVSNILGRVTWPTHWTMICSGTTTTGNDPFQWNWFEAPQTPIAVKPDGTFGVSVTEGTKTYAYQFSPLREP